MVTFITPKSNIGDLFAASAAVQVAIAAEMSKASNTSKQVLANCFGYGTEQGSFVLEAI